MNAGSDKSSLVRLGLDTVRTRRACGRLGALERPLVGAVKRAMPWLLRKRTPVTADAPRAVLVAELLESLEGPFHRTPVLVDGRHAGMLLLDGPAIAASLDGALAGGNGADPPPLLGVRLTPAQAALAARIGGAIVEALALGSDELAIATTSAPAEEAPAGLHVVCALRIGTGMVMLVVPAAAVDDAPRARVDERPKMAAMPAATLDPVEVDVVAELGRVTLPLAKLARLKVGDVLRLPLSTTSPAEVRVAKSRLFAGTPTAQGQNLAIELRRHAA